MELNFAFLVGPLLTDDGHRIADVSVHRTHHRDHIMHRYNRRNQLVSLVVLRESKIGPIALVQCNVLAIKEQLGMHICETGIVLAADVHSCHRGMVGNLLCQVVIAIRLKFVSFT